MRLGVNMNTENTEINKHKKLKKILIIVLIVFVVLILLLTGALFFVGNYLVNFAIKRNDDFNTNLDPGAGSITPGTEIINKNREAFEDYTETWEANCVIEPVSVISDDGLTLKGNTYTIDANSHNWCLLIHGYRSTSNSMKNFGAVYGSEYNFNALIPDMRACGESEGEYLGMGYLDAKDMLHWLDLIIDIDPNANIFVSGVSMGGATTMMLSGLDVPSNVKCFIEDCGYTSVWDIFAHELDFLFGLPTFPILNIASVVSKSKAGYNFKEASSLSALSSGELPMMFIHGENDAFVLYSMLDTCYQAKTKGYKEKLTIEDAGHGESYLRDPDTYFTNVKSFLSKYFTL